MLAISIKTRTEVDQRACLEHAVSRRDRLAFSQWPDQHTLFPWAVPSLSQNQGKWVFSVMLKSSLIKTITSGESSKVKCYQIPIQIRVSKDKKLSDPSHPEFGRCINVCLCASCKSAPGSRDLIRVGFNSFGWLLSELMEAVGTNEHELSILYLHTEIWINFISTMLSKRNQVAKSMHCWCEIYRSWQN